MIIVKVRSPYIIQVAEAGQIGSKIELSIWNNGAITEPTSGEGFYSLSKLNASTTNITNSYNVSNYVKEFIDNVIPYPITLAIQSEGNKEWVNFRVKRYKLVGTTYTLLDNITYVGVNGYTNYSDGVNKTINTSAKLLINTNISETINKLPSETYYVNYLVDSGSGNYSIQAIYSNLSNTYNVTLTKSISTGISNYKIPLTLYPNDNNFILGNKVTVNLLSETSVILNTETFYTYINDECKYSPVICTFINRYGGWENLTFFKQQTNTITTNSTNYKLMPDSVNYNVFKGQVKTFNANGTQVVKLNTGFVDENYSELIQDLLLSETVLLDYKPVTVKTQGSDLKTYLKDRMINYEIDFEYAYNLINDVV